MIRPANRMHDIAPFRVMQILARARELEATGRDIVHMEIGEPDFVSPEPVIAAGIAAAQAGQTHYTPAAGLLSLRETIAAYYGQRFSVQLDPAQILVTPGASGALQLVLGAFVNPGERVLLTDPGYPCNRHMVSMYGGMPVSITVEAAHDYAITPAALRSALQQPAKALMLASPANPTGNRFSLAQLHDLNGLLRADQASLLICDEIYQGLQYDGEVETALALGADNVVVINSLSKYFGMTGWRVGWIVAPEPLIEPMERLAQNIFLAAPTLAQHAACAAFGTPSLSILEQRRQVFAQRRDFLHAALASLGLDVGSRPSGAFYLYVDVRRFTDDSMGFAHDLLEMAGVAVTPGADFGAYQAAQHVRFAYTTGIDRLAEGVERLRRHLRAGAD